MFLKADETVVDGNKSYGAALFPIFISCKDHIRR